MCTKNSISKVKNSIQTIVYLFVIFMLASCQVGTSLSTTDTSLYQQLGGSVVIKSVIKRTLVRLHRDKKLSEIFSEVDENEFTTNLDNFICQISGGGCEYQGAEMIDVHAELFITKAEFDHFVSLFIFSMRDEDVPFLAQNKLLALLAGLRHEVIEL